MGVIMDDSNEDYKDKSCTTKAFEALKADLQKTLKDLNKIQKKAEDSGIEIQLSFENDQGGDYPFINNRRYSARIYRGETIK